MCVLSTVLPLKMAAWRFIGKEHGDQFAVRAGTKPILQLLAGSWVLPKQSQEKMEVVRDQCVCVVAPYNVFVFCHNF